MCQGRVVKVLQEDFDDCAILCTVDSARGNWGPRRAYKGTGDMMAAGPGCWLALEVAKERKRQYGRIR